MICKYYNSVCKIERLSYMLYLYITHTCTVFETEPRFFSRKIWLEPNRDCRSTRSKDGRFKASSSKWCKLIGLLWVSIVDSYEVVSKIKITCFILALISERLVAKNSSVCCNGIRNAYPFSISKSSAIFNFTFPVSTVIIQMQSESPG